MLHKTKGICINFLKYKETSIIAKIYTQAFGLQSYLVNSVRTEKPKFSLALFQPLTLLDMVVYHKPTKVSLQRVAELRCKHIYQHIPFDIQKTSLAVFLSEILLKTLQSEESNPELFDFLENSFLLLDEAEQINNFAIYFLLNLLDKQGLLGKYTVDIFWQLYQAKLSSHPNSLQVEMKLLEEIRHGKASNCPNKLRQSLLNYLLAYFRIHYDFFGEVKSLPILRGLLS